MRCFPCKIACKANSVFSTDENKSLPTEKESKGESRKGRAWLRSDNMRRLLRSVALAANIPSIMAQETCPATVTSTKFQNTIVTIRSVLTERLSSVWQPQTTTRVETRYDLTTATDGPATSDTFHTPDSVDRSSDARGSANDLRLRDFDTLLASCAKAVWETGTLVSTLTTMQAGFTTRKISSLEETTTTTIKRSSIVSTLPTSTLQAFNRPVLSFLSSSTSSHSLVLWRNNTSSDPKSISSNPGNTTANHSTLIASILHKLFEHTAKSKSETAFKSRSKSGNRVSTMNSQSSQRTVMDNCTSSSHSIT